MKTAIGGLPSTLLDGPADGLFDLFDALTEAANNAERTDIPTGWSVTRVPVLPYQPGRYRGVQQIWDRVHGCGVAMLRL